MGWKRDIQRNPLQTSTLERLGLDFGRFWDRFLELFSMKFAEHWGAFAIQDRFENLPSASLQKERRFPFHVKSGLSWGGFARQSAPRRTQDVPRRAQDAPRRDKTRQVAHKTGQRRPKRPPRGAGRCPQRSQDEPKMVAKAL